MFDDLFGEIEAAAADSVAKVHAVILALDPTTENYLQWALFNHAGFNLATVAGINRSIWRRVQPQYTTALDLAAADPSGIIHPAIVQFNEDHGVHLWNVVVEEIREELA